MREGRPFRCDEALGVFVQQVDIIQMLRTKVSPESNRPYKITISNSNFLCSPMLELKTLEPIFKNDPEDFDGI
jgi:hypothetical protein